MPSPEGNWLPPRRALNTKEAAAKVPTTRPIRGEAVKSWSRRYASRSNADGRANEDRVRTGEGGNVVNPSNSRGRARLRLHDL
jgi:hypothetical protein